MSRRPLWVALVWLVLSCAPPQAFAKCTIGILAVLPVTMRDQRPLVNAKINGADALFIADSGAFFSTISPAAAEQFKLRLEPAPWGLSVTGVGGESRLTAVTTVKSFALADIPAAELQFVVAGNQLSGAAGLLGQNVFRIADVEYDLANGVIRLMRPHDCRNTGFAYLATATNQDYSVMDIDSSTRESPHTIGTAFVNDAKIRITFDTGAATSLLSTSAAARAGVQPGGDGVVAGGSVHGVGRELLPSWIGPFASFRIGQEEIRNTRLRFGDLNFPGSDMLLGADFFLSHRIYVASSQRKLYFTYNGGPVFNLNAAPAPAATAPAGRVAAPEAAGSAPPAKPAEVAGQPTDAEGFSRRGNAFAARHDYEHALADLTRACELAPDEPRYFYARGLARLQNRQPDLASSDFDQVLKLKADDVPALVARASLNLRGPTLQAAIADLDAASRAAAAQDDIRLRIGFLYSSARVFPRAIIEYDKWIGAHEFDVSLPDARNARCWARALLGTELDKALADCNAAVKARRTAAAFLDSRGLVHLRMGALDKAVADYDASLKLNPRAAWSLYGRGLARVRKGQTTAGQADLAAAAALYPQIQDEAAKYSLTP
jgi:tetratricopeptide (TPR) repeat protein/predicted aspartyl protease